MTFRVGQRVRHEVEGECVIVAVRRKGGAIMDGYAYMQGDGWEGWTDLERCQPADEPRPDPIARRQETWPWKPTSR